MARKSMVDAGPALVPGLGSNKLPALWHCVTIKTTTNRMKDDENNNNNDDD
jgi:hypothetical protein